MTESIPLDRINFSVTKTVPLNVTDILGLNFFHFILTSIFLFVDEAISGVNGLMVCSRLCHENDACTGVLVGMYGSPRAGECYPIAMDLEDVYIAPYMRLFERRSSFACYLHRKSIIEAAVINLFVFGMQLG